MNDTQTETRVEYGVRYGYGETEVAGKSAIDVQLFIDSIRRQIASGEYASSDYEPMTLVARVVTTTIESTPWESCLVETI